MEWTASPGSLRTRERRLAPASPGGGGPGNLAGAASTTAGAPPETSTLVSIYRCDSELRVSEVIYSDHVGDSSKFMGGTDYDWLPQEEAEAVMGLKRRARDEQRSVRDTVTLTWEGTPRSFRIAVFPEKE